jgi:IS4 transposase
VVLRAKAELPAAELALKYEQLWAVESIFGWAKTLLETRRDLSQMRPPHPRGRVL